MGLRLHLPNASWPSIRKSGVYSSGALYAIGLNLMLGTALWSAYKNSADLHMEFVDWIPFILASLGLAIINLMDKSAIDYGVAFGYEHGGYGNWQARAVMILGSVLLAGGTLGSILVLLLRYLIPDRSEPESAMGMVGLLSVTCVISSSTALWLSQIGTIKYDPLQPTRSSNSTDSSEE